MKQPVLNLITPPDKLHNNNFSITLIHPSTTTKEQFNTMAIHISQNTAGSQIVGKNPPDLLGEHC